MVSNDAIRRGSFPDEEAAQLPDTQIKPSSQVSTHSVTSPPWLDILHALTSNTWIAAADRELLLAHTRVTKTRIDAPYRCAFNLLAGRIMVDLQDCHAHHLSESAKCSVPAELACLYIDELAHISSYALHIDHIKSGEPWLAWSQRFSLGEKAASPWLRIAEEFPVLIHRLHCQHKSCMDFFHTFFKRFSADRVELTKSFDMPLQARISKVRPHFSRGHHRSLSGMHVFFENGSELYYKPKPVDADNELKTT